MWSVTRASVLSALFLIACKEQPVEPADCPDTTTEIGGICRTKCTGSEQCLLTELCERGACMPEPITEMPRIKVLTVDPVPVERGASVAIDFGAVSTDYVHLEVLWDDGSSTTLHDSTIEHFGTKTITGVQQPGTVRFTARKNGVDVSAQDSIRLEDGLPRIDYFTVEPQRVDPGQTVTISWRVSNETEPIQISIENGAVLAADAPAEGTIMYDVLQPTAFILTSGTLFARAKVEVNAVGVDPQILRFEMRGPDP